MAEDNGDEKQFFKDFSAAAEQTVEEVRGFEVNYFNLIERIFRGSQIITKGCRATSSRTLLPLSNLRMS
ncbi:MAG: hypothetical protein WA728_13400 [Xanthobacteraceae bacterium]